MRSQALAAGPPPVAPFANRQKIHENIGSDSTAYRKIRILMVFGLPLGKPVACRASGATH